MTLLPKPQAMWAVSRWSRAVWDIALGMIGLLCAIVAYSASFLRPQGSLLYTAAMVVVVGTFLGMGIAKLIAAVGHLRQAGWVVALDRAVDVAVGISVAALLVVTQVGRSRMSQTVLDFVILLDGVLAWVVAVALFWHGNRRNKGSEKGVL